MALFGGKSWRMSWGFHVIYLWVLMSAAGAQNVGGESRLVQITQGPVRGYRDPEGDLFAFYSIPYATVRDRFKAPVAPPTWLQTFEAVDRGIICPQSPSGATVTKIMQEDCLIANVFVPETNQTNLPVLVNVHGGAFQIGSGASEPLKTLSMNKNIIIVNFNYRLAMFGFLCLGTENAPGNAGMKDQVALLRWVKDNIANFGGNPDDITIAGCSAGSMAVNLLTLSETTKGLFSKVISGSGASTGAIAVQVDPIENAKNSAKLFNFTNVDDINALEEFYLTASIELLTSRTFRSNEDSAVTFGPCVEGDIGGESFLVDAPYNLLRRGDYTRYPTIFGFTDMEGLSRFRLFSDWSVRMNAKFSDFLPADLQFESEEQMEDVAEVVKEFYFGSEPISNEHIPSYLDYFTDVVFAYPMMRSVKLHFEAGNNIIYLYEYSFVDNNTSVVPGTDVSGANHCAQARAVFDENETSITEEYRNMKSIMRGLWANFITTGKPVLEGSSLPTWPPVGADRSPHMSLGRTVELKGALLERRARFWDDIYERFYRAPEPPAATDSASAHKNIWLIYLIIICYSFSWN